MIPAVPVESLGLKVRAIGSRPRDQYTDAETQWQCWKKVPSKRGTAMVSHQRGEKT